MFFFDFEEIFNTISDGSFLVDFLTTAMLRFFHYLIFKNSFGLFVCLTVVGITESTESITVVSTAGVSTISAIVSAKTVSVGIGMTVVSRVEDSGISLSLGVSLTLLPM